MQFRLEAFNLFNRANFAPPSLIVFTGAADNEQPLSTFGRIRSTDHLVAADAARRPTDVLKDVNRETVNRDKIRARALLLSRFTVYGFTH